MTGALFLVILMGVADEARAAHRRVLWSDPFRTVYELTDDLTSPDGKWYCDYAGYGNVWTEAAGANITMNLSPKAATRPAETRGAMVTTRKTYNNFVLDVDVRTVKQLRTGSAPNTWEVAWVVWHVMDSSLTETFYYFVLKTNGAEFGKLENGRQYELVTPTSPRVKLGSWSHWTVSVHGNRFIVWVDGVQVIDYTDTSATPLPSGKIGLYTEDAHVQFDNVRVLTH